MTLTTVIFMVLLLYVLQIFLQETTRYRFNLWTILGNRDHRPEMSVIAARLDRAKNNMMEALPLFLGLALLAVLNKNATSTQVVNGATVFLVARILYVPIYAAGIPVLRSLVWLTGMAGMLMMALPLF
ncbi:MAG: MAPEG family protein [Acidiferrobacterales bacterium]